MKKVFYPYIVIAMLIIGYAPKANAQGGVAISPGGSAPDNSAGLDVNFPNKGALMPRMSTAQRDAITSPAAGLTIFNTDCSVYNYNAGTPSSPNWVTVNATNALVAGVSIAASPVGTICAGTGTTVTFTATPASGINAPDYQWQVNGADVGTNSPTYATAALNNGDVVTCILTSSEACVTGSPATSNPITMVVNSIPSTPGSISGSSGACANSSGNVYSIGPVAGATSYSWTVPGDAVITSGASTTSITVTFGTGSGYISVAAVNGCGSSSSSSLPVTVSPPAPGQPGTISGTTSVDSGATGIIYSISPVNNATTYTWSVPADATITDGQGTTSVTVTFGADSGNISVTAGNSCGTSSASSLAVSVIFCGNHGSGSQTFTYTGGEQTFTVPSCVFSVKIECWGAQGGTGSSGQSQYLVGGNGGYVYGNKNVTPGTVLYVFVGGGGGSLSSISNPPGAGGYNGGAAGGTNGNSGAGGGGASDVRLGGTSLSNRIIVAGGGGGGASANCGPGGIGGYPNGGMGGICNGCTNNYGGFGGTQSTGGNGGTAAGGTNAGGVGSIGTGGTAGAGCTGGGGGGYYGGGGGAAGCCGGPGGGGSSYYGGMDNTTGSSDGVQTGNGQVEISW